MAFFAAGIGHSLTAIAHNTTIQMQVSDDYRGRVLAVYLMSVQLGLPVGALLLGSIADVTGTAVVALATGIFLVFYFVFLATRFHGMIDLDPDEEQVVDPGPG